MMVWPSEVLLRNHDGLAIRTKLPFHPVCVGDMGRAPKWIPQVVNATDIVNGHTILAKYTSRSNTRILGKYKVFCRLNGLSPEDGLEPWVGQMVTSGLSPGTISTYVSTITQANHALSSSPRVRSLIRAVQAFHTHVGGRGHAPDVTPDVARQIASKAMKQHPELASQLWLLLVCGVRASCLDRLKADCVSLSKGYVTLQIRFSKGVRKLRKRRQVKYPLKDLPPAPKDFKRILTRRVHHPFPARASKINEVLRKACESMKLPTITSGTFRRAFAARIKPHCKKEGIELSEMLVHTSSDMAKAHYDFDT